MSIHLYHTNSSEYVCLSWIRLPMVVDSLQYPLSSIRYVKSMIHGTLNDRSWHCRYAGHYVTPDAFILSLFSKQYTCRPAPLYFVFSYEANHRVLYRLSYLITKYTTLLQPHKCYLCTLGPGLSFPIKKRFRYLSLFSHRVWSRLWYTTWSISNTVLNAPLPVSAFNFFDSRQSCTHLECRWSRKTWRSTSASIIGLAFSIPCNSGVVL
jgi:hypothetical protein